MLPLVVFILCTFGFFGLIMVAYDLLIGLFSILADLIL
jgi:hypothetical protein